MGVAILQGIQDTLDKTSMSNDSEEPAGYPRSFVATCSQEESLAKLKVIFEHRTDTQIMCGRNAEAVAEADVVLLWLAAGKW